MAFLHAIGETIQLSLIGTANMVTSFTLDISKPRAVFVYTLTTGAIERVVRALLPDRVSQNNSLQSINGLDLLQLISTVALGHLTGKIVAKQIAGQEVTFIDRLGLVAMNHL